MVVSTPRLPKHALTSVVSVWTAKKTSALMMDRRVIFSTPDLLLDACRSVRHIRSHRSSPAQANPRS